MGTSATMDGIRTGNLSVPRSTTSGGAKWEVGGGKLGMSQVGSGKLGMSVIELLSCSDGEVILGV